MARRRSLLVVAGGLGLVAAVSPAATAGAARAPTGPRLPGSRPAVRLELSRTSLPATGGTVTLHLEAAGATRCRFSAPAPLVVPAGWVDCRDGIASGVARIPASDAARSRRWHVTGWAIGRGGKAGVVAYLTEAAAPRRPTPPPSASSTPSQGTAPTPIPSAAVTAPSVSAAAPSPPSAPLAVTTATLPPATVGAPYVAFLAARGGEAPYTWAVLQGSLPPGLGLDPRGTISGVATTAGTTVVTFGVRDATSPSAHDATVTLAVSVVEPAPGGQASTNWSGYVVPSSGPLVTEVSGQFTVPVLDCGATLNAGAVTWAGVGGAMAPGGGTTGVLLQTGITTDCVNGLQVDHAFWEHYPSVPNNEIVFAGLDVAAGDVVEASVYESTTGSWVTRVDDRTTGTSGIMVTGDGWGLSEDGSGTFTLEGSTAGLAYAGGTSAEWIVEDYEEEGAPVALADYGTVTFSQLTTSLVAWSLAPDEAVSIVQSGTVLSAPSSASADAFSVSYTAPGSTTG